MPDLYFKIQFNSQNSESAPPPSLCHFVSVQNLRVWHFQASLYPHIPIIINPTATINIFQKGMLPHQITQLTFVYPERHYLLSLLSCIQTQRLS